MRGVGVEGGGRTSGLRRAASAARNLKRRGEGGTGAVLLVPGEVYKELRCGLWNQDERRV